MNKFGVEGKKMAHSAQIKAATAKESMDKLKKTQEQKYIEEESKVQSLATEMAAYTPQDKAKVSMAEQKYWQLMESKEELKSKSHLTPTVLFVGGCGVGKSSLINLLLQREAAKAGNDVKGVTKTAESYSCMLGQRQIHLIDTPGMGDFTHTFTEVLRKIVEEADGKRVVAIVYVIDSSNMRFTRYDAGYLKLIQTVLQRLQKQFVLCCSKMDKADFDTQKDLLLWKHNLVKTTAQYCEYGILEENILMTSKKEVESARNQFFQVLGRILQKGKHFERQNYIELYQNKDRITKILLNLL